jgi:hypothetical protein
MRGLGGGRLDDFGKLEIQVNFQNSYFCRIRAMGITTIVVHLGLRRCGVNPESS